MTAADGLSETPTDPRFGALRLTSPCVQRLRAMVDGLLLLCNEAIHLHAGRLDVRIYDPALSGVDCEAVIDIKNGRARLRLSVDRFRSLAHPRTRRKRAPAAGAP